MKNKNLTDFFLPSPLSIFHYLIFYHFGSLLIIFIILNEETFIFWSINNFQWGLNLPFRKTGLQVLQHFPLSIFHFLGALLYIRPSIDRLIDQSIDLF